MHSIVAMLFINYNGVHCAATKTLYSLQQHIHKYFVDKQSLLDEVTC